MSFSRRSTRGVLLALMLAAIAIRPQSSDAQQNGNQNQASTQGVYVDTAGVLRNRRTADGDQFRVDRSLGSSLCYVSLPKLFAELRRIVEAGEEIPERMRCLDGLVQVTAVFVEPERNDLIIAGPAEDWDASNPYRPRGTRTGRPVIQLEDLIVALRQIGPGSRNRVFGCTLLMEAGAAERVAAYQKNVRVIRPDERDAAARAMQQALGNFDAKYYGVSTDTRYALVSVEADYLLKRLCLGVDPIPVKGLRSHLLDRTGGSLINRFWFVADYEPLLVSPDGHAYEIRGRGLRVLASDSPTSVGTNNPAAKAFAEEFTQVFPELEQHNAVFADLHNLSNLAIATSLIAEDRLHEVAGWDLSWVLDSRACPVAKVATPTKAEALVNYQRNGRTTMIVGGGVEIRMERIVGQRKILGPAESFSIERRVPADAEWSLRVAVDSKDAARPTQKTRRTPSRPR